MPTFQHDYCQSQHTNLSTLLVSVFDGSKEWVAFHQHRVVSVHLMPCCYSCDWQTREHSRPWASGGGGRVGGGGRSAPVPIRTLCADDVSKRCGFVSPEDTA